MRVCVFVGVCMCVHGVVSVCVCICFSFLCMGGRQDVCVPQCVCARVHTCVCARVCMCSRLCKVHGLLGTFHGISMAHIVMH